MRAVRPLLLATSIALAAARPAIADEVDADAAAEADELFRKAGQAYDAGDFHLAHSLYEKAFEKKKTHDIAAMLAQTEMKLGKPCEADVHLAWAIANFPPSLADERRARVLRARADVKKHIGALRIETSPADASVQVDFHPLPPGALPGPVCAAAGDRFVLVSRDGFAVERRIVPVEPGSVETVTIELRRVAPPPASSAAPSAEPSAAAPRVPIAPPRADDVTTKVAFSGIFAGVAAVLTGAILMPIGMERGSQADAVMEGLKLRSPKSPCGATTDLRSDCERHDSLRRDQALFQNAGLHSILWGTALGAAAGSLFFLRSPSGGSRPGGPRVTVGVAPDGAFIALKGAF